MLENIANFLSGDSPFVYLFLFLGKLIEVSLATLRSQLILKGHRLPGAIIAALEYTFWLCITASAISGFAEDPLRIVVLVLAFALGQIMGSFLEEKLALGYCTIWGIFKTEDSAYKAAEKLRTMGQAVTIIQAEGINGAVRPTLVITVKRKSVNIIRKNLFESDPDVIISVHDIQKSNSRNFADFMK